MHYRVTCIFLAIFLMGSGCKKSSNKVDNPLDIGDIELGESIEKNRLCREKAPEPNGNTICEITNPDFELLIGYPVHIKMLYNIRGELVRIVSIHRRGFDAYEAAMKIISDKYGKSTKEAAAFNHYENLSPPKTEFGLVDVKLHATTIKKGTYGLTEDPLNKNSNVSGNLQEFLGSGIPVIELRIEFWKID